MRKLLGFAIAVAALAAFLAISRGRHEIPRASSPLTREETKSAPADAPVVDPANVGTSRSPAGSEVTESALAETTPHRPRLIVLAISKKDRSPLARIRVGIYPMDRTDPHPVTDVDGSVGDVDHRPLTGEDGRAVLDLDPGVALGLYAEGDSVHVGAARADVAPLNLSETRTITLELPCGNDSTFFGIVVADEGGAPIEGASVLVSDDSTDALRTGPDGKFDLELASWRRPYLRIEAKGFAPALVPGAADGRSEDPVVVRLFRSGTLIARILDREDRPISEASMRLTAKGYQLGQRQFSTDSGSLPDDEWSRQVDPEGTCRFDDLPPNVPLHVEISRANRGARTDGASISLSPGQVLERVWKIGAGCKLAGRVLDAEDSPVPGIVLWLVKSEPGTARRFDRHSIESKERLATSNDMGTYEFADVDPGSWLVGPSPGKENKAIAPYPEVVEIAAEASEVSHDVHVVRGLYIRGRVVDSKDSPVSQAYVDGLMKETHWFVEAKGGDDGSFSVGPLVPGEYELSAIAPMHDNDQSDSVTARSGDADVVLRLRDGGILSGQVVDDRTGRACSANLVICQAGDDAAFLSMSHSQEDGTFRRPGLPAGTYDVTAWTPDGRIGRQLGIVVRPGAESGGSIIQLVPGARLRIRYEAASGYGHMRVRCGGSFVAGDGIAAGSDIVVIVPAGGVSAVLMSPPQFQEVDLAVGEEKTVVLKGPK